MSGYATNQDLGRNCYDRFCFGRFIETRTTQKTNAAVKNANGMALISAQIMNTLLWPVFHSR
jgi:hypothetical protein